MPKVKLIFTQELYEEDYMSRNVIREGISDWEEISEDDLKFLQENFWRLQHSKVKVPQGFQLSILVQDTMFVADRVHSLRVLIGQERAEREAAEAAEQKKRDEAAEKRLLKKRAKTEAEELRLLESLKEKYEK